MTTATLDLAAIRAAFPILQQQINGKPLAFLDSGASSQKPNAVIDALSDYYQRYNANVHRGVYRLSEEATAAYEQARRTVATFLGARSPREVIFTRNTTEAINLVARSWGDANLQPGDRILLTLMEHHSNIVPWQQLAQRRGAELVYLGLTAEGRLDLSRLEEQLHGVKLVALTHQSNVLGTINPISEIAAAAHAVGALVLVDGAQSVPHMPVDVQTLGADFLAFSGHKICGPTGIGVLWGRRALLEAMPPFLGGGSMIDEVGLETSTYAALPARFEAGTPAIAEAIGLAAALDYLSAIGIEAIQQHEHELTVYALAQLGNLPGLRIVGPREAEARGGAISFDLAGVHPHDVAAILDREGIAVRAGHHCTQPLHRWLDLTATTRASFYLYNTREEIDRLADGLQVAQRMFL